MEEINMINEIESIFSKSEISLEDISDLQMMDIYYEGKVTDFLKGSYDKAKKIVSAIFSFIKKAIEKIKPVFMKLGSKIGSLYKAIMSKIRGNKSAATEAFDLFGIEASTGVDEETVANVNKLISITMAIAVSTGVIDGRLVLKKWKSGFLRGFIGFVGSGLIISLILNCLKWIFIKVVGLTTLVGLAVAHPLLAGAFTGALLGTVVGGEIGGAIAGVRFPENQAGASTNAIMSVIATAVLGPILTDAALKKVKKTANAYAKEIVSIGRQENRDIAESSIDKILSKTDWVSASDITYNEAVVEKLKKLKSSDSKKALENYKKQMNASASKYINDAVDAVTKEELAQTVQASIEDYKKLLAKIGMSVAE